MRKFAAVFLLLSLCISISLPLQAQTRPRRVGPLTTPANPQATPPQKTSTRPPELGGAPVSGNPRPAPPSAAATANEPEEVGEGDVVRVSTTLVTVPVSVMDRAGKYIPDLRQEDFRIYEDGVEQQIAYFASIEKPFTVALMIDTSGSTQFQLDEIQDAAIAFVDQLRPDDRVMVFSFADEIKVLAEATSDRYTLRNAIRRARTGHGTRLYDAVDVVINQHLNRVQGRKAIVLFTDGVDTTSRRASSDDNLRDAEELDALIYPVQYDTYDDVNASSRPTRRRPPTNAIEILIDILNGGGGIGGGTGRGGGSGSGSSRSDYARADAYLNDLARRTGARLYRADSIYNLERSFALVAEELRRQYSLGYYPKSQAQAGQRRQIRVRVNQPNLVVRARDSYISNSSTGTATAQGPDDQRSRPELRKRQFTQIF